MRIFIAVLVLLMAPMASAARSHSIVVYEVVSDSYWPISSILQQFEDAGVSISLRHGKEQSCSELRKDPPKADIILCERDEPSPYNTAGGTSWEGPGPTFVYLTRANPNYWFPPDSANTLCHELMHAFTHIGDNEDAKPGESCVWGSLDHLGPFDVRYLHHHLAKF